MKKSRKIGIGIAAVIVAGSLLGGDPSPAGEELVTKPNIEVRTEAGAKVTTPKVAESKVTTPKVTTPKKTKPKVTTPKKTTPKKTESAPKKVEYIVNTNTKTFHKKTCHHVKKINNPITSTDSPKELSKKYSPCKICNP